MWDLCLHVLELRMKTRPLSLDKVDFVLVKCILVLICGKDVARTESALFLPPCHERASVCTLLGNCLEHISEWKHLFLQGKMGLRL